MSVTKVDKIEVYTQVDFNNAIISDHAVEQAIERFNLTQKNPNKVSEWIRNKLRHSTFKSTLASERYGIGRLYMNDDIALILDIHKDKVVTIYKMEVRKQVKHKINTYLMRERNRLDRLYKRKQSKYKRIVADKNIERATLERDLIRARSNKRYNELLNQINNIEVEMANMMRELSDLQAERDDFEASIVAHK